MALFGTYAARHRPRRVLRDANDVWCPKCGADPGEGCTYDGMMTGTHSLRRDAFREAKLALLREGDGDITMHPDIKAKRGRP